MQQGLCVLDVYTIFSSAKNCDICYDLWLLTLYIAHMYRIIYVFHVGYYKYLISIRNKDSFIARTRCNGEEERKGGTQQKEGKLSKMYFHFQKDEASLYLGVICFPLFKN